MIAYFCWNGYYTSYLQVVHGLSSSEPGYVDNAYSISSSLWAILADCLSWLLMVSNGLYGLPYRFNYPVSIIFSRQRHTPIPYLILCQVLIAIGGGTLTTTAQIAAMFIVEKENVASIIALLALFSTVGGSIGSFASGMIWTHTVYAELLRLLPEDAKDIAANIYQDLDLQLHYPVGDPVREAVIQAYVSTQGRMVVVGLAVLSVAIPAVAV
jgi:hypothetical protein